MDAVTLATPEQLGRLVALFGHTPKDQLQTLFSTGVLTDLRTAKMTAAMARDMRKMLAIEPNLKFDRRSDGWELLKHSRRVITSVSELELVPFLKEGEQPIRGYDLLGRAEYELDAYRYGQEDAEFIHDHQDEIPEEFRKFYLIFPRTIWRYPGGSLSVACLSWDGERWRLGWGWLEGEFGSGARFLRPVK